jgi:hypothetical protein
MKFEIGYRLILRRGFACVMLLLATQWLCQRPAFGQTATVDFLPATGGTDSIASIVSGGNSTQNLNVVAGAPATTYTVDLWLVILDPGVADSSIGFGGMGLRGRSSVTSGGAFLGGTASSNGGATSIGVTADQTDTSAAGNPNGAMTTANAGPFDANSQVGSVGKDYSNDKFADLGGTSTSSEVIINTNSLGTDTFGGGSSGVAVGPTAGSMTGGWAWELGTVTVTSGTVSGTIGATTKFTPTTPVGGVPYEVNYQDPTTGSSGGSLVMQVGSSTQWTVISGVSTNTSVLNLTPSSATFNVLQGAPLPATVPLSLHETTGTSGNNASYTSIVPSGFSVNPSSGTVNAGTTTTLNVGLSSTATMGQVTGTYSVSNTSIGDVTAQGNLSASFTANIGNAVIDNSGAGTFGGSVLTGSVTALSSYAGLSSTVSTNLNGSTVGGPVEHTVATIMAGNNSGNFATGPAAVVSMMWRNRTTAETPLSEGGTQLAPPLPVGDYPLISDVVNLYGMANGSTGAAGSTPIPTDPFVLQMTFDPTTLAQGDGEAAKIARGSVYLAYLNPNGAGMGTPQWQNADDGDLNGIIAAPGSLPTYVGSFLNYVNSLDGNVAYPDFTQTYTSNTIGSLTNAQLNEILGAWGVDGSAQDAWTVIDHNSDFAVVPEPSTIVLAAFGLLGCVCMMRRKKNLAVA